MSTLDHKTQHLPLALTAAAAFVGGAIVAAALPRSSLIRYRPDKVWKYSAQKGAFGSVNRPTAGPRFRGALPRGDHDIQLYSLGTPNGMKVTCLLEELCLRYGVEYDAWMVIIWGKEPGQFRSGFVEANPNSKIPALLHYRGSPSSTETSAPTRVFESAAIMMYLCERYDTDNIFLPMQDDPLRSECLSWLFWVQGSAPFLGGGFGHFFQYAPIKIKYAIDRYTMETKRQLDVLERHLGGKVDEILGERLSPYAGGPYLCGERLTVADLCCYPWYGRIVEGKGYNGSAEFLNVNEEYPNVIAWARRVGEREGVRRGCMVNTNDGLTERHSSIDFDNAPKASDSSS